MLKEFTIKILLIILDSILFGGILLFCIMFIFDYNYNQLISILTILILITIVIKLSYWVIFDTIKLNKYSNLLIERFVATILVYLTPLYILWNTPTLYINREISIIIYILMLIFFMIGISIEKKFYKTIKRK